TGMPCRDGGSTGAAAATGADTGDAILAVCAVGRNLVRSSAAIARVPVVESLGVSFARKIILMPPKRTSGARSSLRSAVRRWPPTYVTFVEPGSPTDQ